MVASIVSIPPSSVAETSGILVESDLTWSNDMTITENVRVVDGGSLTLSNADFSVSDGVEIFVDTNSSISINGATVSPSLLDESDDSTTILPKILCLHGGGDSATIFQSDPAMQDLIEAVSEFEFIFVDAPEEGGLWIRDPPGGKDEGTSDPDWADTSISFLDQYISENGPFYGILGFSQGAAMVPVYLAQSSFTFEMAIMFNGYMPTTHHGLIEIIEQNAPFDTNSLIFEGEQDPFAYGSDELAGNFSSPRHVISNDADHHLPFSSDDAFGEVVDFFAQSASRSELEAIGVGFSLIIDGQMHTSNSTITGADISSSGSLYINNTALDRVGPIILSSDDSSIFLEGDSSFSNSSENHDLQARAFSKIEWGENVTGSAGLTNKWERRVAGQSLVFDAIFVTYEITGMYEMELYTNFSNQDGISFIDGGKERIVEIAWSDDISNSGPIWTEQAIVSVTEYRTAWNPASSSIGNYGGGQFQLSWNSTIFANSGTPYISWDSLRAVDSTGMVVNQTPLGTSLLMEGIVTNSGSAAASFAISCEEVGTGADAQISPSFPSALVDPGQQGAITFEWRSSLLGAESLNCEILTPTQLADATAFGGGAMHSNEVTWVEDSNDGDLTFVPAIIALLVGASIGGYFLLSIYRENNSEEEYNKDPDGQS